MERNRIIVDTSAYSYFVKGNRNIKSSLQKADEIYMNPIVIGELLSGFSTGKKDQTNMAILNEFLSSARVDIIYMDSDTAERYRKYIYSDFSCRRGDE